MEQEVYPPQCIETLVVISIYPGTVLMHETQGHGDHQHIHSLAMRGVTVNCSGLPAHDKVRVASFWRMLMLRRQGHCRFLFRFE
jgi:hypothetical protein